MLRKDEQVITGCNSGINRSQVAAAVIGKMGIRILGILAGGDSAMNPEADFPSFANPSEIGEESAMNFEKVFGYSKSDQIGSMALKYEEDVEKSKHFFQDYINGLSPTHFITFGPCGVSVLRRLLQREGSLKGFTITHFTWGDEIAHPPQGVTRYSTQSYECFAEKIRSSFVLAVS